MENWKKYLPFLAIGGVAIWLILKFSKSGSSSQVVNRVIPVQNPKDETALAQIQAQFELGKLQIASGTDLASKQIDAEKQRLEFANRALEIQGNYGLEGLKIESAKATNQAQLQSDLAKIALEQNGYDTQLRINAASELLRQQRNASLLNSGVQTAGGLLQQLLKGLQQSQSRQSGSGGSSGGATTPPFNPNATRARQANQNIITSFIQRYLSNPDAPIAYQQYDDLGYAVGYDLQPFYDTEASAFDNWLDFQTPTLGSNIYSDYPVFGYEDLAPDEEFDFLWF